MCMYIFASVGLCVPLVCRITWGTEEDIGVPGVGVGGGYEMSHDAKVEPGPLQKQQVFLPAAPSVQPTTTEVFFIWISG